MTWMVPILVSRGIRGGNPLDDLKPFFKKLYNQSRTWLMAMCDKCNNEYCLKKELAITAEDVAKDKANTELYLAWASTQPKFSYMRYFFGLSKPKMTDEEYFRSNLFKPLNFPKEKHD